MIYIPDASYLPVSRVFEYLLANHNHSYHLIEALNSISSLPCRFNMFTRPRSNPCLPPSYPYPIQFHQDSSLVSPEVERDGDLCISKDLPETRRQNCGWFVGEVFFLGGKSDGEGKVGFDKSCWCDGYLFEKRWRCWKSWEGTWKMEVFKIFFHGFWGLYGIF